MESNVISLFEKDVTAPKNSLTIADRLAEATRSTFVGRQKELSILSDAIQAAMPPFLVAFIHGPGGIGKSHLLQAALNRADPEVYHCYLDCREIEPTPKGFQIALGAILEIPEPESDLSSIVACLENKGQRTVVVLDTYEAFGLIDTWLRQVFVPALPDNTLTIIAGREAPNSAWYTTPGWQDLFREIRLRELSADDAGKMLELRGVTQQQIKRVQAFARGYPLVLEMAAVAIRSQKDLDITEGPPPEVLRQLTQAFLAGLPMETSKAVEATSVVRRVTESLLRELLQLSDVSEMFANLQALPFIDVTTEGLIFHDAVRDAISSDMAQRDPERYRTYRRRAWLYFTEASQRAIARTLWQYTADLLYMIENPVVRGAFFPKGATEYRVEPAASDDAEAIRTIVESSEPEESARHLMRWWHWHPETFRVVKAQDGKVVAFHLLFEPGDVSQELLMEDSVTAAWLQHLADDPIFHGERVLFGRKLLDRATGEVPSPALGACFLDYKLAYMELRPGLRRVYAAVRDIDTYGQFLFPLGFRMVETANVAFGKITYHSIMNDFGPDSVDGWLSGLIGKELGVISPSADEQVAVEQNGKKHSRKLLTVLFTDIVGSTEKAIQMGDRRWLELLGRHNSMVREELTRFEGREIETTGDGFLATFESPVQAIQCSCDITKSVQKLGIEIRAGLHLGECEAIGERVHGIAVHLGARVAAKAEAGEVLVSSTVKDAVTGSGIRFENRGAHNLKGMPKEWQLFSVKLNTAT